MTLFKEHVMLFNYLLLYGGKKWQIVVVRWNNDPVLEAENFSLFSYLIAVAYVACDPSFCPKSN